MSALTNMKMSQSFEVMFLSDNFNVDEIDISVLSILCITKLHAMKTYGGVEV
jgi:hypothetical protein